MWTMHLPELTPPDFHCFQLIRMVADQGENILARLVTIRPPETPIVASAMRKWVKVEVLAILLPEGWCCISWIVLDF